MALTRVMIWEVERMAIRNVAIEVPESVNEGEGNE